MLRRWSFASSFLPSEQPPPAVLLFYGSVSGLPSTNSRMGCLVRLRSSVQITKARHAAGGTTTQAMMKPATTSSETPIERMTGV